MRKKPRGGAATYKKAMKKMVQHPPYDCALCLFNVDRLEWSVSRKAAMWMGDMDELCEQLHCDKLGLGVNGKWRQPR